MSAGRLAALLTAASGASLVLSIVGTLLAIRVSRRIGFVDHPGGHKSHRQPMPYGGGTAVLAAAWLPLALIVLLATYVPEAWVFANVGETARAYLGGLREQSGSAVILLLGGVVLHLLGLYDDVRPLSAPPKLIITLLVGVMLAGLGGMRIAAFLGPWPSIVLTAFWVAVVCNAFNFLDNMDGLSSGVAAICVAFFVACGLLAGQVLVPALGCVFLGAIVGFWLFNFPPARIFMGDGGSLLIGYMLAVMSILTTYYESGSQQPAYPLAMPLVILAVPLYDLLSVVTIRLTERRNPLKGDQRHFSHRLVERGLSRRWAVLTIYLATATTALLATLLPRADLRQTITVGVSVLLVLSIIAILESAPTRES